MAGVALNVSPDASKASLENMYNLYQNDDFYPRNYDDKLLEVFQFYLKNREFLCSIQ